MQKTRCIIGRRDNARHLVGFIVIGPLVVTASNAQDLPGMRTIWTDTADTLGLLASEIRSILGCKSLSSVCSTQFGIVNVTRIGF